MKKTKKLLALFLSVVMLLSMFVVTTSAEEAVVENAADGFANITIKTSDDIVNPGDTITVTINVATDYDSVNMYWPILFSGSFFELVEGSQSVTEEMSAVGGHFTVNTNVANSNVFTPEYTMEEYQCVVVQWMGINKSSGSLISFNAPDGMDIYTFDLKVKDDVALGMSGEIVIGNENTFDTQMIKPGVTTPAFSDLKNGNITFNCKNAIVSYPVPDIVPVEGTSTVVDTENNIIRGIDINVVDNIDKYIRAVCCEYEVTPSKDNRIGTGTKVTLTIDGEFYKEYIVVIAGDVNGDALVDVIDYIVLDYAEASEIVLSEYENLAADLVGDNEFNVADKEALDSYLVFAGEIDQATGRYVKNN